MKANHVYLLVRIFVCEGKSCYLLMRIFVCEGKSCLLTDDSVRWTIGFENNCGDMEILNLDNNTRNELVSAELCVTNPQSSRGKNQLLRSLFRLIASEEGYKFSLHYWGTGRRRCVRYRGKQDWEEVGDIQEAGLVVVVSFDASP